MSGGFSLWLYPHPASLHRGRSRKGRTGVNKNKWMEAAVGTPNHGHMDVEPLDTLPSSGFPGHMLQCPEQMQLSSSRNSARLLAQTPPWTCPQPRPPSLSTPRAWGFVKVMSPCLCDRPLWRFPRHGGAGGFLVFKSMLLKKNKQKNKQKKNKKGKKTQQKRG